MLGYIIQRLLQAALVMLAMSALVFVGVYAIGNPIDVLISPEATQDIRAAADFDATEEDARQSMERATQLPDWTQPQQEGAR